MKYLTEELFEETVAARRYLHAHPEVGFDLENTAAFVKRKLEECGVAYTEEYGRCSVCGLLGDLSGAKPVLALRADMDALPIREESGEAFSSLNEGMMHACGHDSHTAVLLTAAKILKQHEAELPCGVKLMFQPSEECAESGAKMMVENGVLDGVTAVLGVHCENVVDAGIVGIRDGAYMAACIPIELSFIGKSGHAAMPETAVDAIAMAVRACPRLKAMVEEEAQGQPYIWSVGYFHGGTAHNIIAGRCDLRISFRYYDQAFADRVMARAKEICDGIAREAGGQAELEWHMSAPPVINDSKMVERFRRVIREETELPLTELPRRMSSEDFSWYMTKKPGAIFRFGTRNEEKGCTALAHHSDFRIDEDGMRAGVEAFVAFALHYGE